MTYFECKYLLNESNVYNFPFIKEETRAHDSIKIFVEILNTQNNCVYFVYF